MAFTQREKDNLLKQILMGKFSDAQNLNIFMDTLVMNLDPVWKDSFFRAEITTLRDQQNVQISRSQELVTNIDEELTL